VIAPPPGQHGGDAPRLAAILGVDVGEILELSASLNPLAPDPAPIIARHLDVLDRYPDHERATVALAEVMGVDRARLVLTNGGAEAIALVAQLHPVGWADPCEFSLYRRHLRTIDPGGPRWMSDPHNPTGRLASEDERAFVRDEAFYPLATGTWSRGDPDTIVIGSLTKVFACPGLRIGYVMVPDEETATRLRETQPRWAVNGLASAALPHFLASADLPGWRRGIAELRGQLQDLLVHHGLVPEEGSANYLWVPHAPGLRDRLASRGVLVRSGASFGHPDAVRIAVPNPDGLARLEKALEEIGERHV